MDCRKLAVTFPQGHPKLLTCWVTEDAVPFVTLVYLRLS
jgi:hypothetical protein